MAGARAARRPPHAGDQARGRRRPAARLPDRRLRGRPPRRGAVRNGVAIASRCGIDGVVTNFGQPLPPALDRRPRRRALRGSADDRRHLRRRAGGVRVRAQRPRGGIDVLRRQARVVRPALGLAAGGATPRDPLVLGGRPQRRPRRPRRLGPERLPRRHPRLAAGAGGLRAALPTGGSSTCTARSTPSPGATRGGTTARACSTRTSACASTTCWSPRPSRSATVDGRDRPRGAQGQADPVRPRAAGDRPRRPRLRVRRRLVLRGRTHRRPADPLMLKPPIEPMLAKLADRAAGGRGLALRAQVGRLPRHRLQGRRRACTCRAATPSPSTAISRSCAATPPRACPRARGGRRDRHRLGPRGLDFDLLQLRLHPAASRVAKLAAEMPSSFVAFDLLAVGDDDLRGPPAGRARASSWRRRWPAHRPRPPHPCTRDRGVARTGSIASRAPASTASSPSTRRRSYEPGKRVDDQGQARPHRRLRGGRLPLAQGRPRRAGWDRSCSASTTTAGALHHVGVTSSFTMAVRAQLAKELEPLRENALARSPVARVGGTDAGASSAHARRRRAGGARARTCPGSRCGSSASAR